MKHTLLPDVFHMQNIRSNIRTEINMIIMHDDDVHLSNNFLPGSDVWT